MIEKLQDITVKLVGILILIGGVALLAAGLEGDSGVFMKLGAVLVFAFHIGWAVAFWRMRGWAFLLFSAALLVGWMVEFVRMVIAWCDGTAQETFVRFGSLALVTILIAILGHWSVEKRFRPHLDIDH